MIATKPAPKTTNEKPVISLYNEGWADKQEVMELMHVSERTLQQWRSDGILPYSRIRGKIYYRIADVIAMLEKNICVGV